MGLGLRNNQCFLGIIGTRIYCVVLCLLLSVSFLKAESFTLDWSDYQDISFEETENGYVTTLENVDDSGVYITVELSGTSMESPPVVSNDPNGDHALYLQLDDTSLNNPMSISISFSYEDGTAAEVTNVSFDLFDIDEENNGKRDVVSGISAGNELTGIELSPDEVDVENPSHVKYDKKNGTLTGEKSSSPDSNKGTVGIDFGDSELTEFEFQYENEYKHNHKYNGDGSSSQIGLGDIHFDVAPAPKVPETGTNIAILMIALGVIYIRKKNSTL